MPKLGTDSLLSKMGNTNFSRAVGSYLKTSPAFWPVHNPIGVSKVFKEYRGTIDTPENGVLCGLAALHTGKQSSGVVPKASWRETKRLIIPHYRLTLTYYPLPFGWDIS